MDILEEFRDLSLEEWNFRHILKENLEKLMKQQRIYWMQRGRIKWATLGDENTKFFHTTTTIQHNRNSIMMLKDGNGQEKHGHEENATLLWESFKHRLATSKFPQMHLDLRQYISPRINLEDLATPFFKEEIDSVVSNLPNGKSPGPDGLNTEFMKKCWPVIYQEIYNMFSGFFDNYICLQSINRSYITLVPKVQNPTTINDFRPKSLMNSSIKIITKMLANRLHKVILQLIHQNQYGFFEKLKYTKLPSLVI
jgi:hypothetical protein